MIGNGYWATGITVHHGYAGSRGYGWGATLDFLDDGFMAEDSTQGTLCTRYYVTSLARAIDLIKADAERLGITFRQGDELPMLYYKGDGEDPDYPPPVGWRAMLADQAERIGWHVPGGVPA
jgi:hypothetical protein